jgi:hypothetical protein
MAGLRIIVVSLAAAQEQAKDRQTAPIPRL